MFYALSALMFLSNQSSAAETLAQHKKCPVPFSKPRPAESEAARGGGRAVHKWRCRCPESAQRTRLHVSKPTSRLMIPQKFSQTSLTFPLTQPSRNMQQRKCEHSLTVSGPPHSARFLVFECGEKPSLMVAGVVCLMFWFLASISMCKTALQSKKKSPMCARASTEQGLK